VCCCVCPCFVVSFRLSLLLLLSCSPRSSPSFPTRRSSDLITASQSDQTDPAESSPLDESLAASVAELDGAESAQLTESGFGQLGDRKSTRLNSSHVSISYAVFCLKKKIKKSKLALYTRNDQ